MLSAAILAVAWLTIGWIGPPTRGDAWLVGALWVAMTLAFEFLAGHYFLGTPWPTLLAEYNLMRGRVWVIVLLTTAVAPPLAAGWRGVGGTGR